MAGTIDPSCDPTPCPSPPVHPPAAFAQAAGKGKNRARYARFFFCRAVRGKGTNGTTGERPTTPRKGAKR